jgi:hypothetical protein
MISSSPPMRVDLQQDRDRLSGSLGYLRGWNAAVNDI